MSLNASLGAERQCAFTRGAVPMPSPPILPTSYRRRTTRACLPSYNPGAIQPFGLTIATAQRTSVCAKAVAASVEAPTACQSGVCLRFVIPEFFTHAGANLAVVGNQPQLGAWNAGNALRLKWEPGHRWSAEIALPYDFSGTLEYKVVLLDRERAVWEPGSNRVVKVEGPEKKKRRQTPPPGSLGPPLDLVCIWGKGQEQVLEIKVEEPEEEDDGWVTCHLLVPLFVPKPGQRLVLIGDGPELGDWLPGKGLELVHCEGHMWMGEAKLPADEEISGKLVLMNADGSPHFEPGENRTFMLASPAARQHPSCALILHWGLPDYNQVVPLASARAPRVPPPPAPLPATTGQPPATPEEAGLAELASELVSVCHFVVPSLATKPGQHLVLVGNAPELGSWDPANGLRMKWQPGHAWVADVNLPCSTKTEAKLVLCDNGRYVWEAGGNRALDVGRLITSLAGEHQGQHQQLFTASDGHFTMYWGEPSSTPLVVIERPPPEMESPRGEVVEAEVVHEEHDDDDDDDVVEEEHEEEEDQHGADQHAEGQHAVAEHAVEERAEEEVRHALVVEPEVDHELVQEAEEPEEQEELMGFLSMAVFMELMQSGKQQEPEVDAARQQLKQLVHRNMELEQELMVARQQAQEAAMQLRKQQERQGIAANAQVAALQRQVDEATSQLLTERQGMAATHEEVAGLSAMVSDLKAQLAQQEKVEKQRMAAAQELRELQRQVEETTAKLLAEQQELASASQDVAGLSAVVNQLQAQLQVQLQVQEQHQALQQSTGASEEVITLRRQVEEATTQLALERQQLALTHEQMSDLSGKVSKLQSWCLVLEGQLAEAKQEYLKEKERKTRAEAASQAASESDELTRMAERLGRQAQSKLPVLMEQQQAGTRKQVAALLTEVLQQLEGSRKAEEARTVLRTQSNSNGNGNSNSNSNGNGNGNGNSNGVVAVKELHAVKQETARSAPVAFARLRNDLRASEEAEREPVREQLVREPVREQPAREPVREPVLASAGRAASPEQPSRAGMQASQNGRVMSIQQPCKSEGCGKLLSKSNKCGYCVGCCRMNQLISMDYKCGHHKPMPMRRQRPMGTNLLEA